jgi:3-hydroxyisobutyrate dehydrogenase
MGLGVALRLRDLGFSVGVRDIRPEPEAVAAAAGATVHATPAALAKSCDVVITLVVDAAQTDEVVFGPEGLADAMRPQSVLVAMSTMPPAYVAILGQRLAARGIAFVDAPCSGGPARARDGTMSTMIAGPAMAMARCGGVLEAISSRRFPVGERPGDGAKAKIVNNLLAGANLVAAAEAVAMGERLGLDLATIFGVVSASSGGSWVFGDRIGRVLEGDRGVRARLDILRKDLSIAVATAQAQGSATPMAQAAYAAFDAASKDGWGDEDDSAMVQWFRDQGVSR